MMNSTLPKSLRLIVVVLSAFLFTQSGCELLNPEAKTEVRYRLNGGALQTFDTPIRMTFTVPGDTSFRITVESNKSGKFIALSHTIWPFDPGDGPMPDSIFYFPDQLPTPDSATENKLVWHTATTVPHMTWNFMLSPRSTDSSAPYYELGYIPVEFTYNLH